MSGIPSPRTSMRIGSARFVRKYLTGIFLLVCLVVFSVFLGFSYKATSLIQDRLLQEGQAFFRQIDLTREWIDNHDGVYVKLVPGVEINPYLMQVPGLKVVIEDKDGEKYTFMHSPIVTGEISRMAAAKGIFKFKITDLVPINPDNAPDAFERGSLEKFAGGAKEHFSLEESGKEVLFRYMAPFILQKPCLRCHASGREDKILGGISVTIGATSVVREIRRNRIYLAASALGIVALFLAIIYFISKSFITDLKKTESLLFEMATRDPLTGLLNRREALRRIGKEHSRAGRLSKLLSVFMIDIDRFKEINDAHGHAAGDDVLKDLSRKILESVRDYDIVCRYGGEEFLVVTPEAEGKIAQEIAERLRCAVEEMVITVGDGSAVRFTISAGVAQWTGGENVDQLIARADAALFEAKASGRNRVVYAA